MARPVGKHLCKYCGEDNPSNFQSIFPLSIFHGDNKGRCKVCRYEQTKQYNAELKQQWQLYLGTCADLVCSECSYDAHPAALCFHHKDPSTKSFTIGHWITHRACSENNKVLVKAEIDKCTVLCANCHAIEHWGESYATS